jgi:hypothetical protein
VPFHRCRELRDLGGVTVGHVRGWRHAAASATRLVDPFWIPMAWRERKVRVAQLLHRGEALHAIGARG